MALFAAVQNDTPGTYCRSEFRRLVGNRAITDMSRDRGIQLGDDEQPAHRDLTLRVNLFNPGAPRLGIAAPAGETIAT